MSTLRFRASDDDEGDEEENLLPRALEVPSGSEPEDDGSLPSTALQYLRYVRREQGKQDEVVTADLAKLRIKTTGAKKQPHSPPAEAAAANPAAGLSLSRQWQQSVESDFSALRCRMVRWKARHAPQLRRQTARLPSADEREAWLAVCRQGADGDTVTAGLAPPSLHTVSACTQRQLHCLLEHLLQWTRRYGLGSGRAAWLFAVMAALEKPVLADTCSTLREVARLCRAQRDDKLARDDSRLPAACLLICLVGRYFGQADLADPWR